MMLRGRDAVNCYLRNVRVDRDLDVPNHARSRNQQTKIRAGATLLRGRNLAAAYAALMLVVKMPVDSRDQWRL